MAKLNIPQFRAKPTLKKPTTMGKNFDKKYKQELNNYNVELNEIDNRLNEKEQSLKKQIWNLAKMESLVHNDDKLSAIYNEMEEDGEEKYGYHYNETIMNIIFNEYVLNDVQYLQKYKNAIPVEKKRRDKRGISQLQKHKTNEGYDHNNSLPGVLEVIDNYYRRDGGGDFDDREYLTHRIEKKYNTMKEPIEEKSVNTKEEKIDFILTKTYDDSSDRAKYKEDDLVRMTDEEINSLYDSVKKELDETTGAASSGAFAPALGYNKKKIAENEDQDKERKNNNDVDETTTSTSSGQYSTPYAWAKSGKQHHSKKPAWSGGEIIGEGKTDYFTNPEAFKNILSINENDDPCWDGYTQYGTKEKDGKEVPNCVPDKKNEGMNSPNNDSRVPMAEHHLFTKEEKIAFIIANKGGDIEELDKKSDEEIDKLYDDLEKEMGLVNNNINEKAKSEKQQQFMGIVRGVQKGDIDPSEVTPEARKAAKEMKPSDVKDFASTKHKGIPTKVEEETKGNVMDRLHSTINNMLGGKKFETLSPQQQMDIILKASDEVNKNITVGEDENISENPVVGALARGAGAAIGGKVADKVLGEYSREDLDVLTKTARNKIKLSSLLDWAGKNILFSTTDPTNVINQFLQDNRIDIETLKNLTKVYLEDLGYDETQGVQTADQDVLVDLLDTLEDDYANQEVSEDVSVYEEETNSSNKSPLEMLANILSNTEMYNHLKGNEDALKRVAQETVDLFFDGDVNKALEIVVKQIGDDDITNENSIIQHNPETMATSGNNPTSMANTMKESENIDEVKVTDDNKLKDFGTSNQGNGGFNNKGNKLVDTDYKKPENFGGKTMDNITEDSYCRKDEEPVPGKVKGQKGACRKKKGKHVNSFEKPGENKYNIEQRKEREQDYERKLKQKETKDDDKKSKKKEVNEDRKPSALVQLDRLKKDNQSNFNVDMRNSNSAEIAKGQDELRADAQYTDVDNPKKLSQQIEKEKLKQNKGEAFENAGNSTNDNNKEIPKRNFTTKEQEQLSLDRGKGMHDIVYDNEPDERFEERMKKDMGEEFYNLRQEKMKYREDAPMYNKDTEPVDDGIKKVQYEKEKAKYNDKKGFKNESFITGKYSDEFNNTKFVDFKINESKLVDKLDESFIKLNLDGIGNIYDSKLNENTQMRGIMNSFDFYFNGKNVVKMKKGKQTLVESDNKTKQPINEEFEKMKKLWNYKPSNFTSTHNVRKNWKNL